MRLGHETALLEQAFRSIDDGNSQRALAALDELEASKPDGALAEERAALRVSALCAAGRVDEARRAADRFLSEMPASVQAGRVRASCAFAKPSP